MKEGVAGTTNPAPKPELSVEAAGDVLAGLLSKSRKAETPKEPPPPKPEKEAEEPADDPKPAEPTESDTEHESGEEKGKDTESETDDEQPLYTVKVNGEEVQVTLAELQKGYGFNKHNTQQAQANAAERKKIADEKAAFEAEAEAARAERQQLVKTLKELERIAQEAEPAEPDWERLRAEDPDNYRDTRDRWELYKERKAKLAKEREEAEKQVHADNEKKYAAYLAAQEEALLTAVPEWRDPTKMQEETTKMAQYATKSLGFHPDELRGVSDHRIMLLMRKAMLYDAAQSKKPAIQNRLEKPIAPARPGGGGKSTPNPLAESRKRLAEVGTVDAAADLLTRAIRARNKK
jgi:hypothetical protein